MPKDVQLPFRIVIADPSEQFQLRFAKAAAALLTQSDDLHFEASGEGLVLWGLWEQPLEIAVHLIKSNFPNAVTGKPEIAYLNGPQLLEPLLRMAIDTPEDYVGDVLGDLIRRRGLIVGLDDSARGKLVTALVPAAEAFGYASAFAAITRQRAAVTYEFAGYQPIQPTPNSPMQA